MKISRINKCMLCNKSFEYPAKRLFENTKNICIECNTRNIITEKEFKQECLNIFSNLDSKGVDLAKLKEIEDKINKEFKNEYKNR